MSLLERPLGEVLHPASEAVPVRVDKEYRIAGIYSFGRGLIDRGLISGSETSYRELTRLRPGQLVMSKLNAWEGALAVVPEEFGGSCVSPEYPVFDIDERSADSRYIAHLAAWPELWGRLTPRGSMVRRKRTIPATLLGTRVPLPSLDEQCRIAALVDDALGKLHRVHELRRNLMGVSCGFHESIFNEQVVVQPRRLGDLLILERDPVDPDPDKQYIQIGIRSFGNGIFRRETLGADLSKLRYFKVRPHRLIVSNIMAWEGAIAVSTDSEFDCIGSSRFLSYRPSDGVDIRYLNYYFQSKRGRDLIRSTSTGTVVRNQTLSIKDFDDLRIPLPELTQQRKLVAQLDIITTRLRGQEQQWPAAFADLRKSTLNAAFSGRL